MKRSIWVRWAAFPLLAVAVGFGVWGAIPHNGTASISGRQSAAKTPAAVSLTGKWVYRTSDTVENLYLKQGKNGTISGHGDSARKVSSGKIDHSHIDVHSGTFSKGKLALSIYITPIDWGGANATLVLVENLRCNVSAQVLHCRMDAPLYVNVRNIPQDFYRRP